MESIVLSIVSKYLKDYVNNFRKEQISVNFLRGQGVMRDLDINVDAINELIQSANPAIKISKLLINTLSVNAPIMSLKTKPIVLFVDELFVEMTEIPVCASKPRAASANPSSKDKKEKEKPSKYGFLDRIGDSISFEINRISIAFCTLGKLKTEEMGPWRPPVLLIELLGNRFFCTNQNGIESELDTCFRIRQTKRPILFIYKQLQSKRVRVHLVNSFAWSKVRDDIINGWSSKESFCAIRKRFGEPRGGYVAFQLLENTPITVQLCFRKRMDNNFLLGIELAIVIGAIKQSYRQKCLSELLHFVSGITNFAFRADVVLRSVLGIDPTPASLSLPAETPSSSANGGYAQYRMKLTREQLGLGVEEQANLDALDAETAGSIASEPVMAPIAPDDVREGWQRSSLNSDEDPPHLRLVVSVQIDELIVTFPFDGMRREWTADQIGELFSSDDENEETDDEADNDVDLDDDAIGEGHSIDSESIVDGISCSSSEFSGHGAMSGQKPQKHTGLRETLHPKPSRTTGGYAKRPDFIHGIVVSVGGLVHSYLWPEHAAATETVSQLTVKHVSLHEYSGINKVCLFRTTEPLDADGRPLVVSLLPRGVKEQSLSDPEYLPGTCILLKTDSVWPALPNADKGCTTSNTEVHICAVDLTIRLPILLDMATFFSVAIDPRWESCLWGEDIEQQLANGTIRTINMYPAGSSSITVVMNGVHARYFPVEEKHLKGGAAPMEVSDGNGIGASSEEPSTEPSTTGKSPKPQSEASLVQATQLNLDVNMIIVVCKHTLDTSFLTAIVPPSRKSDPSSLGGRDQNLFTPTTIPDLTTTNPWTTIYQQFQQQQLTMLLTPRLEITISDIRISIVSDELDKVYVSSRPLGDAAPPLKDIIKPFTLSVFTSLDPIPILIPNIMHGLGYFSDTPVADGSPSMIGRLFYWPRCSGCIETTFIGIDEFVIDITLLDLVLLTKTVESIRNHLRELDVVGWFFTMFPTAGRKKKVLAAATRMQDNRKKDGITENDEVGDFNTRMVADNSPNELWIFRVRNARLSVLPTINHGSNGVQHAVSIPGEMDSDGPPANLQREIVGIVLKSVSGVYEKESTSRYASAPQDLSAIPTAAIAQDGQTTTSNGNTTNKSSSSSATPAFLIKAQCGGIGISVSGRPIVFLNVDEMDGILFRACSSLVCPTKWLSEATAIQFRYDTRTALLRSVSVEGVDDVQDQVESDISRRDNPATTEKELKGKKRQTVSAIVNIETTPNCTLVLQPRSVLLVLRGLVSELLKGVGCVAADCDYWWQDSVFGFIRTHLDEFIGGDSRKGVIVQVTRAQLVKVSRQVDPVLLKFVASNTKIALVDVLGSDESSDSLDRRQTANAIKISDVLALAGNALMQTQDNRLARFALGGDDQHSPSPHFFETGSKASSLGNQSCLVRSAGPNASSCLLLTLHRADITGQLRSGDKPLVALKFDTILQVQLLQFMALKNEGEEFDKSFRDALAMSCSDITSPFGVSLDLIRAGLDPTYMKSSITAIDLASLIGSELAERSWSILAQLIKLLMEMKSLVYNFWTTVEHSVSAHEATAIVEASYEAIASQKLHFDGHREFPPIKLGSPPRIVSEGVVASPNSSILDDLQSSDAVVALNVRDVRSVQCTSDIVFHLLGESTIAASPFLSSAAKDEARGDSASTGVEKPDAVLQAALDEDAEDIQHEKAHSQRVMHLHHLSTALSTGIVTSFHRVKSLQSTMLSSCTMLDDAIKGVYGICADLEDILARGRYAAFLSAGSCPNYCGWVKKSIGFSRFDRSTSSFRSWAVLINNCLYFLQQPYSKNVDLVLNLDTLTILDPDRSEETPPPTAAPQSIPKTSLSATLQFNNESGSLYVDCESMDNKVMWVDALNPWLRKGLENLGSMPAKSRSVTKSIRKSIAGLGVAITGKSSNPSNSSVSGPTGSSLAPVIDFEAAKSRGGHTLKSAAKGMFKAFSMASNTFSISGSQGQNQPVVPASPQNAKLGLESSRTLPGTIETRKSISFRGQEPASVENSEISPQMTNSVRVLDPPTPEFTPIGVSDQSNPSLPVAIGATDRIPVGSIAHTASSVEVSIAVSEEYTEGGPDISRPTSLNAAGVSAGGDVLAQLDSLRGTITQYKYFLESAAMMCSTELQECTELMRKTMADAGGSVMASSAIGMLSKELLAEQLTIEQRRIRSSRKLAELLRNEKQRNALLLQRWSQAKSLQLELESVLQACTMQHIGTVHAMSKQFDDLQEQWRMLRKGDQSFGSGNNSSGTTSSGNTYSLRDRDTTASFQELVCHLTMSIGEMESKVRASQEREIMMAEEIRSFAVESDRSRSAEQELQRSLLAQKASAQSSEQQLTARLHNENRRNAALEAENKELRARLAAMNVLLKQLT